MVANYTEQWDRGQQNKIKVDEKEFSQQAGFVSSESSTSIIAPRKAIRADLFDYQISSGS